MPDPIWILIMVFLKRLLTKFQSSRFLQFLFIFFVSLFLMLIWFHQKLLLGANESTLIFFNPQRTLETVNRAWADIMVGYPTGITTAGAPTYLVINVISRFIKEPYLVQLFFFLFLLIASGIGIYSLTRVLFPNIKKHLILFSVFFYWFNPISLVNVWWRFLYNYMVFFAFLPIAIAIFIKGIKSRRYVYSLVLGLASGVFSYSLTSLPFDVLLWAVFIYLTLAFVFLEKGIKERLFIFKFLALSFVIFIFINFWWISQFFTFLGSSTFAGTLSNFFTGASNLLTLNSLSIQLGNLTDIVRARHAVFYNEPFVPWANFYNFPLITLLEFILSGAFFIALIRGRRNKNMLVMGGLFLISIFLMKGTNPPFGEIFGIVFEKISSFQVFRNPFEKFSFIFPIAAAPMLAFFVDATSRNRRIYIISSILISATILIWSLPFFTGFVFSRMDESDKNKVKSYGVEVPEYYSEIDNWLKKESDDLRLTVLPLGPEGITYSWPHPYSGVELSNFLFSRPSISLISSYDLYNDLAQSLSKYQLDKRVLSFLPFINSKFVIWRGDINFKERRMPNPDVIKEKLETWVRDGILTKEIEIGKLAVYELSANWIWPKMYITDNLLISNDSDLSDIAEISPNFPQKPVVIVNPRLVSDQTQLSNRNVIAPEKVPQLQIMDMSSSFTDEDLLAKLFYVKHLPTEKYYFLVRLKEFLETPSKTDYRGWFLYESGILGKRAVEIYKLYKTGGSEHYIAQAETNYIRQLNALKPDLVNIIMGNDITSDVSQESLLYQWQLLDRVHAGVSKEALLNLLFDLNIKSHYSLPQNNDTQNLIYVFNLPVAGKYSVLLDDIVNAKDWYLDGKPIIIGTPLILSKGIHELAFSAIRSEIFDSVINQDYFLVDNNNLKEWQIELPAISGLYKIGFDYRFRTGDNFDISFLQDIDKEDSPIFSTQIMKDALFSDWKHWEANFTTSVGATEGNLGIKPAKTNVCERNWFGKIVCKLGDDRFNVEIRNFRVERVEEPKILLDSGIEQKGELNTVLTWNKIDPSTYKIKVEKNDSVPEMLVFSELFNSGWKISASDGTKIPETAHFLVNTYANGWLINESGSYDLTLEFEPQKSLEKGIKVSIFATVGTSCILVLLTALKIVKRKWPK